ncbi:MAG: DinB family protein [Adhaeribacter sp.]
MRIIPSEISDLEAIFQVFEQAAIFQKNKFGKSWQGFDRNLIQREIQEGRHFKIVLEGKLALIFSLTYEDPLIWGEKSEAAAVYLHRIAASPVFRGRGFMHQVVAWARGHARKKQKNFIRMDTWAENRNLINYYVDCGFKYLGVKRLAATSGLPDHYEGNDLCLFEIALANKPASMGKSSTTLEKLAAYNIWANEVLVNWLEELGEAVPASTMHLLSHIANAQAVWLSRLQGLAYQRGIFEEHSLGTCRELLVSTSDELLELAAMPSLGLQQMLAYTNSQGQPFETVVEDILMHVFNHGTYHRAQIARDLRQHSLNPVDTDYIIYVRQLAAFSRETA